MEFLATTENTATTHTSITTSAQRMICPSGDPKGFDEELDLHCEGLRPFALEVEGYWRVLLYALARVPAVRTYHRECLGT